MRKMIFSTSDLPANLPREHLARLWCEGLTNGVVKYDADCPKADEFYGHCEMMPLGRNMLIRATANSIAMNRNRRHIATDGAHSLLLLANDGPSGIVGGAQRGVDINLAPGDVAIFDVGEECRTHSCDGGSALAFYFDRDLLRRMKIDKSRSLTGPLDTSNDACRLLLPYLRMQLGLDQQPESRAHDLALAHIDDLLALALGADGDSAAQARDRGLEQSRLLALRKTLRERALDPGLTADSIGGALGISGRTVQLLLQRNGTTLTDEVNAVRLDMAFGWLRERNATRRSIAEIAYATGFRELSTFYRAFKRRFGVAPGEARDSTPGERPS